MQEAFCMQREDTWNGSVLIYDVDKDGGMELFAATNGNKFHAWNLGMVGNIRWPTTRGNRWNTGFPSYEMPDTNVSVGVARKPENHYLSLSISKHGILTVYGSENSPVLVEIYNITGRKVFSQRVMLKNGFAAFKPSITKGVYFVKVTGRKTLIRKFIR